MNRIIPTAAALGSGSRSSGSKPKASKPKPHHGNTTGGHSHHDYDDCDND
ncbi:hypothetical protein [Streptomyces sp. BE230]|nr:hypothetical protein [Streptomyces sp. BE230]